jgi:chromosome partitioning protein
MVERKRKPLAFVVNAATPQTLIAADAAQVLAQHGNVAPVIIHQRIDFAASMIDGHTAGEVNPRSRSAQEIADLLTYVNTQLRTNA